jgi:hypothetical protein
MTGHITFTGGGRKVQVSLQAVKPNMPALAGYNGYIETAGYIAMQASHFSRQVKKGLQHWELIDGLGYKGTVLQVLPVPTKGELPPDLDAVKTNSSFVEYDFYTFSSVAPAVTIFTLPTHPLNNNYHLRYAVSIDDGPLKIVDFKTVGRSEEWKQNVLRNRAEKKIDMPHVNAGKHTLKIYCIDPGVIVDEIRIDLGGLKNAYSALPETRMPSTPVPASK